MAISTICSVSSVKLNGERKLICLSENILTPEREILTMSGKLIALQEVGPMKKVIEIRSSSRCDFIDITAGVESIIKKLNIREGVVNIYIPHTTAGVMINEGADPDVVKDFDMWLNRTVPENLNYKHLEGNSSAHIKSLVTGITVSVGIEDGKLLLGTWQSIYFCEFDGPRTRKIWLLI